MDLISMRLTDGFGLVQKAPDLCQEDLNGWTIGDRSTFRVLQASRDFGEAASFLSHLTYPATRHVIFPYGDITVFINNAKQGSEFSDYATHIAKKLRTCTARVVDKPARTWSHGNHTEVLTYEARILEVFADSGERLRSVACANDGGRWVYESSGEPLLIEKQFNGQARKKKDRFTSSNLRTLAMEYGFPCPDFEAIQNAGEYVLLEEQLLNPEWARDVEARACSVEQRNDPAFQYYQRGLTWLDHIDTHAHSLITDFERAVQLNPSYGPTLEKHIQRAMEIIRRRR